MLRFLLVWPGKHGATTIQTNKVLSCTIAMSHMIPRRPHSTARRHAGLDDYSTVQVLVCKLVFPPDTCGRPGFATVLPSLGGEGGCGGQRQQGGDAKGPVRTSLQFSVHPEGQGEERVIAPQLIKLTLAFCNFLSAIAASVWSALLLNGQYLCT